MMIYSKKTTPFTKNYNLQNYLQEELYKLVQQDERIFDFIQEAVLDGVWFWDLDHPENEWMSPRFWTTLGYNPDKMPHRSSAWQNIINQDDLKQALSNFVKHCHDPSYPYDQVVRYTHKFGHTVWIRCKGLAIRDENGKPVRMIGAHTDITSLQKAKLDLKRQNDRYQHIIDNTNLGTWEWNNLTNEVILNENWAKLLGYSLSELGPVTRELWNKVIHPEDLEYSKQVMQDHFDNLTEYYECEVRIKHKSGDWIWVLDKGKVVSRNAEEKPEWVIGSLIEITESKNISEQYKLFIEQTPTAIAMFDTNMCYLAVSKKWYNDYGIKEENIVGKSHYHIFPEIGSEWKSYHQRCLEGEILKKDEDRFVRQDGSVKWLSWELRPWYTADKKIGGILMYTVDITKSKEIEITNSEKQTFLEAILDSIEVGIVSCDEKGSLKLFNRSTREWHGLPPEKIDPSQLSRYYGLYRSDSKTPLKQEEIPLLKVLRDGGVKNEEIVIIPKNGQKRYVTTNGTQLRRKNGEVFGAVVAMHDITERKEAEIANFQKQAYLQTILDSADVGLVSCDHDGNITMSNEKLRKWFGLPDNSIKPSEWSNYYGMFEKDGHTPLKTEDIPLLRALRGEKFSNYEITVTTNNGNKRLVGANGSQLIGKDGKSFGAIVALHDITERKKAEDQLRISEAAFRSNFENAAIGMTILDLSGNWLEINNAYSDILGYSMAELKEITFQQITHPDDVKMNMQKLSELMEGNSSHFNFEKRYIHKKGHFVYAMVSVSLVRDQNNSPLYFISQIIDITPRKLAKQKLKETIAKLEGVLEASSQVGIIGTDCKGIITIFNKGAQNLLGYSDKEIIHQRSLLSIHLEKELEQRSMELSNTFGEIISGFEVLTAKANRGMYDTREWTYIKKNGTSFPVQLTVTAIRDRKEITGYLAVATNISEIKEAERELKSLLEITEGQNERLRNFAQIVSHNLKSHSGNFEMLLDLYAQEYPEAKENEILELFKKASVNLSETIGHLNEVVLINTPLNENLVLLPLKEKVDEVFNGILALAKESQVVLKNEVSENSKVLGVEAYLDSILLNLFTNAIKYSDQKKKSYVSVSAKKENKFIVIQVKDNGIGIDLKKHRSRIFGMYKTFHNHDDARGIGLFITKNQVEAIGGSIEVESEVNQGSTFNLKLKYEKS